MRAGHNEKGKRKEIPPVVLEYRIGSLDSRELARARANAPRYRSADAADTALLAIYTVACVRSLH